MPRMFDILREKTKTDSTVSFPREIHSIFRTQKGLEDAAQTSKRLIDAVKKKGINNIKVAQEKYNQTLKVIEDLLKKIEKQEFNFAANGIYQTVDGLTNQLILGNSLLEIIAGEYRKSSYLAEHLVNVCILSLALGLQMNFNKSKLHTLAVAALLHDLGMVPVEKLTNQPGKLSTEETRRIREHTSAGIKIISQIKDFYCNGVEEVIAQHHERINGKGYPRGLKGNELNVYSKILGLVDTYEAMTHPRAHRQARLPHQAIREIMGRDKVFFEPEVIKALVSKISIYPIGSFVRLNTREIAKVILADPTSPLRPLVLVILDSSGRNIPEPQTLDLSKSNSVYIKEAVLLKSPPSSI